MDLGIQGKTALVLGAGGGLGRAVALALAREGAKLALGDIDQGAVSAAAKTVEEAGGQAHAIMWDLADLASIDAHVRGIEERFGGVDILVNITGGPPPSPASGQDPALWTKHFQAMVLSVISITDRVLPSMRTRRWGRVITSTSSGIVAPIPNLGLSNTLRLSLVGWSKTLAREVARDGITSNILAPGRIATGRVRFLDEAKAKRENRTLEEVQAESAASIPAGRYGTPEEFAATVAFLASAGASYITGSVIRIDGGYIPSV